MPCSSLCPACWPFSRLLPGITFPVNFATDRRLVDDLFAHLFRLDTRHSALVNERNRILGASPTIASIDKIKPEYRIGCLKRRKLVSAFCTLVGVGNDAGEDRARWLLGMNRLPC